ncbi:hypothetical protein BE17_28205 [Sorangium cellulosum]|uniref:Uncharacterized protein n=1 Tax=Sorangium cellulosum TaxID=56 RepID=A0A150SA44_SORCE|nr:hypothetical protein BE17_28205 [Sorangium cellulosum]
MLAAGAPSRALQLQRSYDSFLFALQCRDDAMDGAEDAAVHGVSVPDALGYAPGGLFRAAPRVGRAAASLAAEGGFHRLAAWLTAWTQAVDARWLPGIPAQDEMAGMILATAWNAG